MGRARKGETDRTPDAVRLMVSATDAYSPGIRGFAERWMSLFAGMSITAKRGAEKPTTLRYPWEKLTLSPRWRGALRLTGILGRDEIPTIAALAPEYNAIVDGLSRAGELPPCVGVCPANVDARGQSYHLAEDRVAEAYELVRSRNIMPGVLGRICHHPCEGACKRNYYDEPIAIRPLHRVAYERYADHREQRVRPLPQTRDERVAVIGSGPSGLAAAFDLMSLGYSVTCYEKEEHPGGALYWGVPAYRLPRDVLRQEIDDLVTMGMHLKLGVSVGVDVPIDYLIGEYDAVLIAAGLQTSRMLPIPKAETDGVTGALEFLRAGNHDGDAGVKGRRVVVIGGGNVAVDCARVALRVGAAQVTLTALESQDELPAHEWEIAEAVEEGVVLKCSWGPIAIVEDGGLLQGVRMRSCLSVFDAQGRFAPTFADEYEDLDADVVVFAVGQSPQLGPLVSGSDLLLTDRGLLPVDGTLLTTRMPNVFACGEVVTGPGSAIGSISSGHEAAISIDRYLRGQSIDADRVYQPVPVYPKYENAQSDGLEPSRLRMNMPTARPENRATDFRQVELGLTLVEGRAEAARCLRCASGVCVGCTFCARVCPDFAIRVERVDDPESRCVTRYDYDMSKCCFCGLCAEQCPTGALQHTGQYELSFYSRDLATFDRVEMLRSGEGTRATGRDPEMVPTRATCYECEGEITDDSAPQNPEEVPVLREGAR
jgi:NADPH-dependent glutamate synthase beta subunit-like oxidoreductase